MKKIAIYARTSRDDLKIENQLLALRDFCKNNGYTINGEYIDDGQSGKDLNRPEFERLLADLRSGKIRCVAVYKLDRIGRSLQNLIGLMSEFKNRGVQFISITQPINTETPEGKMFWQMLGVFAEFERNIIVDRTKAGLARAIRQGKTLGRPTGSKDGKPRRKSGYLLRWNKEK